MTGEADLEALYPFLHGSAQEPKKLDAALLRSIDDKARHSRETNAAFFGAEAPILVAAAKTVAGVYRRGGRLFSMGNGGSSCDASHIAVEFVHPITAGRPALAAINLVADIAMISAVGNDVGFDHIFLRQLVALARPGDGVIGFSTSGSSENILTAFAKAKELGVLTIALVGHDGGKLARSPHADHCLVVPSDSIHRIQETHLVIYHILWDLVHALLAEDRGPLAGRLHP